ncbi:hypothetical protein [Pseudomonas sp. UFMG81]|uniref:hypothetical protein n=1 Tax=Pseudomonas sp. UFMG81 TaxID=2745936 RepID=UPI00188FE95C|nr:hypothetical protein [Pseudomonas sp. UFMG81]
MSDYSQEKFDAMRLKAKRVDGQAVMTITPSLVGVENYVADEVRYSPEGLTDHYVFAYKAISGQGDYTNLGLTFYLNSAGGQLNVKSGVVVLNNHLLPSRQAKFEVKVWKPEEHISFSFEWITEGPEKDHAVTEGLIDIKFS